MVRKYAHLDENIGEDEGDPGVHATRSLTRLEQRAKPDELGLKLLTQGGGDDYSHEDGEEFVLEARDVVGRVPERKSDEETGDDLRGKSALALRNRKWRRGRTLSMTLAIT